MTDLPLRAELIGQEPYGAPTDQVPVRLNVNENPYPPPASVVAAVVRATAAAAAEANRYPDREAWALREALAAYIGQGITPQQVWPANGSNEVMQQILGAFGGPGRTVLSFAPTYSMYPVYARDTCTAYRTVPRAPDHSLDWVAVEGAIAVHRPTVVLVASPNNPTGSVLRLGDIRRLHELVAGCGVLVVDEAYQEFSDEPSAVMLLPECPRLVVTRTMSKALGSAGLRLGYAVTAAEIVDALRIVRLPYHLSGLTQAAATEVVRHAGQLLAPVPEVISEREHEAVWLAGRGVPVAPSGANFLLIGPLDDAHKTFCQLLERGVLVRETSVRGCLRVSIGTPAENEAFRAALAQVLDRAEVIDRNAGQPEED